MSNVNNVLTYNFIPERLKDARIAGGYSLAELAEKIGISRQAISKYETGKAIPNGQTLKQLSLFLRFPVSFFTKPYTENYTSGNDSVVHFRSLKSSSKKTKKAYAQRIKFIEEIYSYLNTYVKFPSKNLVDLDDYIDDTVDEPDLIEFETIEQIANDLRLKWDLGYGPIIDVSAVLEQNGIVISKVDEKDRRIQGFSQWYKDIPIIILGSTKSSSARLNFSLAHELGHLILHRRTTEKTLERTSNFDRIEAEANYFAGAFLMPANTFAREVVSTSIQHFINMKSKWETSIAAMIMRCKQLEIFNENQVSYLFRQRAGRGMTIKEPLDDVLEFHEPCLLKQAMEILFENNIITKSGLINELAYTEEYIQSLCYLPEGFLDPIKKKTVLHLKVIK